MKKTVRYFIIYTFSLYLASNIAEGIVFENGHKTLLIAGIALTITTFFGKPVINALILPINLITFGLFRWISSAITLYIVSLAVSGFSVNGFRFSGYFSKWIDIPSINLPDGVLALIMFGLIISIITSFLHAFLD